MEALIESKLGRAFIVEFIHRSLKIVVTNILIDEVFDAVPVIELVVRFDLRLDPAVHAIALQDSSRIISPTRSAHSTSAPVRRIHIS